MGIYKLRAGFVTNNIGPGAGWSDRTGLQTNLASDSWGTDVGGTLGHYVQTLTGDPANLAATKYLLQYAIDSSNIYVDGTPTPFASLAAGFTPTSASLIFNVSSFNDAGNSLVFPRFDQFTEGPATVIPSVSSELPISYAFPGNIPLMNHLVFGLAMGFRFVGNHIGETFRVDSLEITGNYSIASYTWYYNPTTNHYQYLTTNPGAPWIPQVPNLSVISVNPPQGPTVFPPAQNPSLVSETAFITGTGISDEAVATLDGVPISNVAIGNQTSISGIVGGFLGSLSGPSIVMVDGEDPTHSGQNLLATTSVGNVTVYNPDGTSASLANGWTYYLAQQTWWQTIALPFLFFSYFSPNLTFPYPIFFNGIWYPQNTLFVWTNTVAPLKPGWWLSISNDFNGAAYVIAQAVPHNPRSFDELSTFAAGSAGMQGGFPGPACVWNNRLVYAEGGYTVGVNQPPIDIYDGSFNHTIALVPTTSTGGIPQAVVTMISANGTVYFSTLDSGTSSANYSGRVFSLSINTGQMVQLGLSTDFATGDVPYSLVWFFGKLWCGTNRADGTASHVYWIRPGIDTNWTQDLALSSKSQGGATSMAVYQGNLYVGCSNQAGTFAQVLKRDTSGNWTTSDTASGGTATTNNAYLALAVFGTNLYATYWNNDTPVKSLIRQFNGSSWTTVYTGSGDTLVPLIGLPQDQGNLLAIGGGLTYNGAVVETQNGTSWTDNSAFLTGNTGQTALPVFGVVVR